MTKSNQLFTCCTIQVFVLELLANGFICAQSRYQDGVTIWARYLSLKHCSRDSLLELKNQQKYDLKMLMLSELCYIYKRRGGGGEGVLSCGRSSLLQHRATRCSENGFYIILICYFRHQSSMEAVSIQNRQ